MNAPTTGVDFYAPFGGEKESSYGSREQGMAAPEFLGATRIVTIAPPELVRDVNAGAQSATPSVLQRTRYGLGSGVVA